MSSDKSLTLTDYSLSVMRAHASNNWLYFSPGGVLVLVMVVGDWFRIAQMSHMPFWEGQFVFVKHILEGALVLLRYFSDFQRASLSLLLVACRTGVIFCVFQGHRGESEASAKRELHVRANLPSYATRGSHSPRACLTFAPVPLKYAKNHACSAGYFTRGAGIIPFLFPTTTPRDFTFFMCAWIKS